MTEAAPSTAKPGKFLIDASVGARSSLPSVMQRIQPVVWRGSLVAEVEREIPEEVPVAFTYNGSSHAVMMATPSDLEDFAVGFSLTEGLISAPAQIESLEVLPAAEGIELRMWIARAEHEALHERRRRLAGPTGCGLCGLESIADAVRSLEEVQSCFTVPASSISVALDELVFRQHLNRQTHAVHAAAFGRPGHDMIVREDVGRHNALDKLAGALTRAGVEASDGFVVLSSRVSIEMVQKAAAMGVPIIIAVSAPTALAVRACESAGMTLIGVARRDAFEVFTHPRRVVGNKCDRNIGGR